MKENINVQVIGIKKPFLRISGKKQKNDVIKVFINDKEIDISTKQVMDYYFIFKNYVNDNLVPFTYELVLDKNDKKIDVYLNSELICTQENKLSSRIFNKVDRLGTKIKNFPKTIFYGVKLMWDRHHLLVPPRLVKRYMYSFSKNLLLPRGNVYHISNVEEYNKWLKEQPIITNHQKFSYNPLISVVIPVYNVSKKYLSECIESVLTQSYQKFEICLADDCSTNEETKATLKEYEKNDKIKIVYREKNGHISASSNSAIEIASGEFIALLDNDDIIDKDALYYIVEALNKDSKLDLIYTDEDKLNENGVYCSPHFKPDFSPDTLMSVNYICHFSVVRKSLIDEIGGFRSEYNGAQDHDLFLRISEKTNRIGHVPKILYHWREIPGSTASSLKSKDYAYDAGKRAIEDALNRRNLKGIVHLEKSVNLYYVEYQLDKEPLVSIIIPTKDKASVLKTCLDSIYERTTYKNYEIIVIDNNSEQQETFDLLEEYKSKYKNFKVLRLECPFNYSYINNEGVKVAKGEYILLLNNDIEIIQPDWLTKMMGYASLNHVGCVGAQLLYPKNRLIQHSGVVTGCCGIAVHVFNFQPSDSSNSGYVGRLAIPYNYSCVTGACLLVKKSKFEEVKGLDEKLKVALNDVDFCVKLIDKGYFNVLLPQVKLIHYESLSRGSDNTVENKTRYMSEINYILEKWKDKIIYDKFYNINLSRTVPFTMDRKD